MSSVGDSTVNFTPDFTIVSTSTVLASVMQSKYLASLHHLRTMDVREMCGFWNFGPATSLRSPFCICDHVPVAKNVKFAPAQKTFRRALHPCISSRRHISDGYVTVHWPSLSEVTTTAIHCVPFQISRQCTGKVDYWQDNIQRCGAVQSPWGYSHQILTDYCMISLDWASANTKYLRWSPNPSPCTEALYTVSYWSTYLSVPPSHSIGLAERQYKHWYRYQPIWPR